MDENHYAIQVWYDNDWIWVTHPIGPTSQRALSTWTLKEEAEEHCSKFLTEYVKTRVIHLQQGD